MRRVRGGYGPPPSGSPLRKEHDMSDTTLDCRGLNCPQPVLETKKRIETDRPAALTVIADNDAAKENVTRFLTTNGYAVDAQRDGALWKLAAADQGADAGAGPAGAARPNRAPDDGPQRIAVFLTSDTMGRGDDVLGAKLMGNFIPTLKELGDELWRIVMVNGAVRLAATPGPILDALKELEAAGVSILVCGTCLDHFGLVNQRAVGQTTNMLDVVTSLQLASKVITP
jgi:selenium metabolism protein YedF